MGYKIDYYKFMKLQLAMENLMLRMLEDMAVLADVEKYMRGSNAIQCKSIDAVNSYIMNKHIETAIPAIESAISNFYKVENSYFFEMYNIDYKSGSIIEEEHLSEVEKELKRLKGEISTFIQNMNSDIKSVDHIVGLESPDVGDFEDGIDSLIKISEKLREDFETYEKSKLMEAKGIQWVVDASVATVEGCLGGIHNMVGYAPETDVELEVPEYTMRASAFYDVFQYTDERYQNVLDNKDEQTKLYYKYMESERLSQYFNNMLFATASMALPFGNKIRGAKLALHEGISLISFAYSADRTYKGYELMQQVENMDADSEANGLFNLDNSEYGKYIKAIGEASNLYTAASASNLLEYKVFGKPVTISSNIATCGEEYISDKTNSLIYQVTGEQNLVTSVISGMVGNGFVNGVRLEIEDAGRLDIDPSVDYDVDFQNNSVIMDVEAKDVPVKSVGEGGSVTNGYSGEEWCRYFRETYGNDNVTWENATPSQLARSWQGSGKYPGIDEYTDITVNKGSILYRGEPNGTEYFTSLDAIEQSRRDATTIFEGLQVEKNPIHGYRGEMQGYLFNEDVASAYGITNANPQYGKGGLPQYYVPDVQDLIDKGILIPVDNIKLNK